LWKVQQVDPGFRPGGVLTMRTTLPLPKYAPTARRVQFYREVIEGVTRLPGVTDAAYISFLPMVMGGGVWPVLLTPGQDPGQAAMASLRFVTPGFFSAAGIPLRLGRGVTEADTATAPSVAVVSESFVRKHWPDQDPIGRRFTFGLQERTVVGVVGDIRVRGLERESEPQVYLSYQQVPDNSLVFYIPKDLLIRSSVGAGSLVPAIRQIVAKADPQLPISDIRTLSDIVDTDTGARAVQARVLGAFAALAFLLAAVGIHGLLAFGVSQRIRELAVRVALGATRGNVLRLVVGEGLIFGGAGLACGLPLAYLAARSLQSLLAGLDPADALTFGTVVVTSVLMTLAGTVMPALQALRVDPATAMRTE
jgi:putative ABC transport system permease protein